MASWTTGAGIAAAGVIALGGLAWLSFTPPGPTAPPAPTAASPEEASSEDEGATTDAPDDDDETTRAGLGRSPSARLCRAVGCDLAQQGTVVQAIATYEQRAAELRADIKTRRATLGPLLLGEPLDAAAVRGVADEVATLRRDLDAAALEALLTVHAVLTAEQRQTLARMVARRGFVAALEGGRKRG